MGRFNQKNTRIEKVIGLLLIFFIFSVQSSLTHSKGYDSAHRTHKKTNKSFGSHFTPKKSEEIPSTNLEPLLVRVTGYGAYENKKDEKSESKRLMAIRASKLDAFRALAERVYGTSITGSSTVKDFVMKHDRFGTVVDSFIRGARVVSISENKGAGFETVLELLLPGNFKDCLSTVNNFKHSYNCLLPLPNSRSDRDNLSSNRATPTPTYAMDSVYFLEN